MSTIVLRLVKGVPLTNAELDDNFSNLNTDKLEAGTTATLTNKTINLSSNTFVATSAQMATAVSDKTGSGALVFATSPTLVTPALGTPASGVVTNLTGTASININGTVGATTATTGAFTTLTTSSTVTINGGTANGVAYLNGSKVLTTGTSFVVSGGNVGIATTTPSNSLQVNGGGITIGSGVNGTSGQLFIDSGTDGSSSSSIFGRGNGLNEWFVGSLRAFTGSGALGMVDYVYGSNPRVFYTNGIERMRILGSGNVGIGTLTPTQPLDVNGNLAITGSARRITGDFSNATIANRVMFQTSTVNGGTNIQAIPNGTAASTGLKLETDSLAANGSVFAIDAIGGSDMRIGSNIRGSGTYLPITFTVGGSERVRIDTAGNVGIGTSSPSIGRTEIKDAAKPQLSVYGWSPAGATDVSGTIYFGNNSSFQGRIFYDGTTGTVGTLVLENTQSNNAAGMQFKTSATERMRITGAGDVGIGTSSPTAKLHVAGGSLLLGAFGGEGGELSLQNAAGNAVSASLDVDASNNLRIFNVSSSATIFYTGGANERMLITSAGNVGIGTNSPTARLDVNNQDANNTFPLVLSNSIVGLDVATAGIGFNAHTVRFAQIVGGQHEYGSYATGNLRFFTRNAEVVAEKMRITPSGDLQIGSASGDAGNTLRYLDLYSTNTGASAGAIMRFITSNAAGSGNTTVDIVKYKNGSFVINNNETNAAANMLFGVGGSTRMTIDSSGNLLVGATSSSQNTNTFFKGSGASQPVLYLFKNSGSTSTDQAFCVANGLAGGTVSFQVLASGNAQNTNNSYGAISDAKLKENIVDASPKLDKLNQVRIVNYNLKTAPDQQLLGVVAQELEQIFPGMVEETSDTDNKGNDLGTTTKSVKYSVFVPMLIKAMQEQQAIITALTARVAALESN